MCGCFETEKNFPFPFAKIYDNRTLLNERKLKFKIGINIDLFPIDGVPSDLSIRKKYLYKLYIANGMLGYKYYVGHLIDNLLKKISWVAIQFLPKAFLQRNSQNLASKYSFEESEFAGAVMGIYGSKEIYDKSIFLSYIKLSFEGRNYNAINQYDIYLTQHYGDYMQLPPVEQQVAHHGLTAYLLEEKH